MSKLTDTLKAVIEPLRYLIGRNSERIDDNKKRIDHMEANPASIQSDMAQSDAEAPDYIKNRIAHDDRSRKVIVDDDIEMHRYQDGYDWSTTDTRWIRTTADKLFSIEAECNGKVCSTVGKFVDDPDGDANKIIFIDFLFDESNWLHYICAYFFGNGEASFTYFGGGEMHVRVSEVEEVGETKAIPKQLISGVPRATDYVLGGVRVWNTIPEKEATSNNYESVYMATSGHLYTKRYSLPDTVLNLKAKPTSSDSGKIPMVQEDGSLGLGEALIVSSSTKGSKKKFRLTVDDNGLITAQEIA